MNWGRPEMLKWLWSAAGVFAALWLLEFLKRRALRRWGDLKLIEQMASSLDARKRRLKHGFAAFAVFFTVLALAEPRLPGKSVFVKSKGIDIVIAVDVSQSMLAEDVRPNRLEKAKLELQELVEKAKGDRIGVVAFAGQAYAQVPLTLDRAAVKLFIKTLSPALIPTPGTAIGEAVRAGLTLYDEEPGGSKVMVLLTDGEDQGSDPLGAARAAGKKGVRVYAVGIGTPKGEMIPLRNGAGAVRFKKDLRGATVVSRLDEKTLQAVAAETKGVYYRSQKGNLEVDRIYADLRGLTGRETGSGWVVEYEPLYGYPLCGAVMLLVAEMALSERRKAEARR